MNIITDLTKAKDAKFKKAMTIEELERLVQAELRGEFEIAHLPPPKNWQLQDSIMVKAPGYWKLYSYKDPKWRCDGLSQEVGGTDMCVEAKKKFSELKEKYKKVPGDLRYIFEPRDLRKFKLVDETFRENK